MQKILPEITNQILAAIDLYRGIVLDAVEQEVGDTPSWAPLRARILKAFGDRGLINRVQQILESGSLERRQQ